MSKLLLNGTKRQKISKYDLAQTEAPSRPRAVCSNRNTLSPWHVACFANSLLKRTEDEYIPDAESVRQVKEQHLQPQTCSLAQCFQLYTKEEQVY